MPKHRTLENKLLIGRNEWCQLSNLGIPAIKAKVDTGAKTSAIHAFNISTSTIKRKKYVHFDIHPIQGNETILVQCKAIIYDQRYITSSNGHKEHRYVIKTQLKIGDKEWEIELTLSNRDPLQYRMLIGREALSHGILIDPNISCNQGKPTHDLLFALYSHSS